MSADEMQVPEPTDMVVGTAETSPDTAYPEDPHEALLVQIANTTLPTYTFDGVTYVPLEFVAWMVLEARTLTEWVDPLKETP
jgi:hypothetical protein